MQMQNLSADREIASWKTNFLCIVLQAAARHPAACVGGGLPRPAPCTERLKMQGMCGRGRDFEDTFEWELGSQVPGLEIVSLTLVFHGSGCFALSKA